MKKVHIKLAGKSFDISVLLSRLIEIALAETSLHQQAMAQLQELVITADKERCVAVSEARIANDSMLQYASRLHGMEQALKLHQQRANFCSNHASMLSCQLQDVAQQSHIQLAQTRKLFQQRVNDVQDQLMHTRLQLKEVTSSLQSARESEASLKCDMQTQFESVRELKSLLQCTTAERDGLRIQLAGHGCATLDNTECSTFARDAEIKDYICSHITALLGSGFDSTSCYHSASVYWNILPTFHRCRTGVDQLNLLTRELAAVKLSESQLQADVHASEKKCDGFILRSKHLEAELNRYQRRDKASFQPPSLWLDMLPLKDLSTNMELQSQLFCKDQELHAIRSDLVEQRQLCEQQHMRMRHLQEMSDVKAKEIEACNTQLGSRLDDAYETLQQENLQQKHLLESDLEKQRLLIETLQARLRETVCHNRWTKHLIYTPFGASS